MGNDLTHFNINAISYIIVSTEVDIQSMLDSFETLKYGYKINSNQFDEIIEHAQIHEADRYILRRLFILRDISGFGEVCFQEVLIAFALLLEAPLKNRIWSAFCLHSMGSVKCSKSDYLSLMKILNSTCHAFGDRKLQDTQIYDLVDSIYTQIGVIDGDVDYEDFYNLLMQHPLLELFISIQFQGQDNYLPLDLKLANFFK